MTIDDLITSYLEADKDTKLAELKKLYISTKSKLVDGLNFSDFKQYFFINNFIGIFLLADAKATKEDFELYKKIINPNLSEVGFQQIYGTYTDIELDDALEVYNSLPKDIQEDMVKMAILFITYEGKPLNEDEINVVYKFMQDEA